MDFNQIVDKALSRRGFLAGAGSVAAAAALAGCADDGTITLPTTTTVYTDADILTFALNLEYLEANFYLYAATGAGLLAADQGTGAGTVNVPAVTKLTVTSGFQQNLLNELAYTEQQHVRFLRSALTAATGSAAAMPALDFVTAFNAIGTAIGIGAFNPFASFDAFVTAAAIFEDIGVTAYNGAAPAITSRAYLGAAAGIMSVEAYHGATLRGYLYNQAATKGSTAYPYLGYFNSIQSSVISPLSSNYGTTPIVGTGTTAVTLANATAPGIVPVDNNALAYHRSTDQVLHIAYASLSNTSGATTSAAGVAKGGFFPNGFNGNIKVTLS